MSQVDGVTAEVIACGEYHYFENGVRCNIVEPWSISRGEEGEVQVVSSRQIADADSELSVEASIRAEQQVFDLCWRQGGAQTWARYVVSSGELTHLTRDGVQDSRGYTFDCFFPLMRVFTGPLLCALAARGPAQVLVPWIKDPSESSMLFSADISERQVEFLGSKDAVRCFSYQGGQYEQAANCLVSERGWLLAYAWEMQSGSHWDVRLAGSPPELECPDFSAG